MLLAFASTLKLCALKGGMMSDQKNVHDCVTKHQVWRHRGCGLCTNPANYMCNQCRAEVNEQGVERIIPNVRNSESSVRNSIVGSKVPEDFIYV